MAPEQGMYKITYGSRRDKGLVRQENQDQIVSFDSSVFGQVFLLADGMGGHEGGSVAANMAITGFKQHFQTLSVRFSLRDSLTEAARMTNRDIFEKSNEKDGGANALRMGSTLVLCVLSGGRYIVAHVGDSRCYVFRNGVLTRLTKDHTAVQKMVDAGIISPEEARNHPDASVLTRALGQRPAIELDVSEPHSLAVDETLLLCSDGLYGYVEEAAIVEALRQNSDPQAAADALLQLALDAGGHDNISLFVIRAEPASSATATEPDPPVALEAVAAVKHPPGQTPVAEGARRSRRLAFWLIGIAVLLAAAPIAAFLRPAVVPAGLREKLLAWGVQLPSVEKTTTFSPEPGVAATRTAPSPFGIGAGAEPSGTSGAARSPVNSVAAIADSAGGDSTAGKPTPEVEGNPATASLPVHTPDPATGRPLAGRKSVALVFPPVSNPGFQEETGKVASRLRAAGYPVTEVPRPVEPNNVWRSVGASVGSTPPPVFISAVFMAGFDQTAAEICGLVACSQPAAPLPAGDHWMFQENFGASGVALYMRPSLSGPETSATKGTTSAAGPIGHSGLRTSDRRE